MKIFKKLKFDMLVIKNTWKTMYIKIINKCLMLT